MLGTPRARSEFKLDSILMFAMRAALLITTYAYSLPCPARWVTKLYNPVQCSKLEGFNDPRKHMGSWFPNLNATLPKRHKKIPLSRNATLGKRVQEIQLVVPVKMPLFPERYLKNHFHKNATFGKKPQEIPLGAQVKMPLSPERHLKYHFLNKCHIRENATRNTTWCTS